MPTSSMKVDRLKEVLQSISGLVQKQVLVGVPDSDPGRESGDMDREISNAAIGYIQENGSPANNIPARPHLVPGVADATDKVAPQLQKAVEAALDGDIDGAQRRLSSAGLIAQNSVRAKITNGPFAPLSMLTLLARKHRKDGGTVTGKTLGQLDSFVGPVDLTGVRSSPLIDTAQYRNSITYVVRKK